MCFAKEHNAVSLAWAGSGTIQSRRKCPSHDVTVPPLHTLQIDVYLNVLKNRERDLMLYEITSSYNVPCKVSLLCVSACAALVCRLLNKLYCNQGEDTHALYHLYTLHLPVSESKSE